MIPEIRARLGKTAHVCKAVILKLTAAPMLYFVWLGARHNAGKRWDLSNLNPPKRRVGGTIADNLKPVRMPKLAYLPLRQSYALLLNAKIVNSSKTPESRPNPA